MKMIVVLFVCFLTTQVSATEQNLEVHFRDYISNWKPDVDIDEIVREYWDSAVTIFPSGQPPRYLADAGETSGMLKSAMQPVIEAGWQKSSVVGFSSCRLSDDLAIVGIEFQRWFSDGQMTNDKAVYVVRSDEAGWKIQAVVISEIYKVSC